MKWIRSSGLAAALLFGLVCPTIREVRAAEGMPGPGTGTGCMALGQGSTVAEGLCRYIAETDTQTVIAADPSPWQIFVSRCCVSSTSTADCQPVIRADGQTPTYSDLNCTGNVTHPNSKTIFLMEDDGSSIIRTGKVHPIPGEYVTVYLGTGAYGFVSVGQDEAFVPGGLPLPE